jgi:hypothetical protein
LEQAEQIVLDTLPEAQVVGKVEYQGLYLFLAPWGDPDEGHLLPFFSVDPESSEFRDFDPQAYDNPLEVLGLLNPPQ